MQQLALAEGILCVCMMEILKKGECSSFHYHSSFFLSFNFAWTFHLYMNTGKGQIAQYQIFLVFVN